MAKRKKERESKKRLSLCTQKWYNEIAFKAYDGAEKIGKERYRLTNKVACANFESVDKFIKRKEGIIANNYRVEEIEMRFLNGDGAEWIKKSTDLLFFTNFVIKKQIIVGYNINFGLKVPH